MKRRTNDQNKKLHVLLTQAGLIDEKARLVSYYTNGRTESSKELYLDEARSMIHDLERQLGEPGTPSKSVRENEDYKAVSRMRKKIVAICYDIGWFEQTDDKEEHKVNLAKLDLFLKERGYLKKPLRDYRQSELPKLVNQFEMIRKNEVASTGSRAVNSLLSELRIEVEKPKSGRSKMSNGN